MNVRPSQRVQDILGPAYAPCSGFLVACSTMRWHPAGGHVPRGYCGATGAPDEVRLVLVVAEPGDPQPGEAHPEGPVAATISSTSSYAYECFRKGRDLFHRNVRKILDLCFPGVPFELQMRMTWITESVLCSAAKEGGSVPKVVTDECRKRYLDAQLSLFDRATVVALGSKAAKRLSGIDGVLQAFAAAPPGCNFSGAEESWRAVADAVKSRAV